jgi:hypothetical protein
MANLLLGPLALSPFAFTRSFAVCREDCDAKIAELPHPANGRHGLGKRLS